MKVAAGLLGLTLIAVVVRCELDRQARELSLDVCERSDVDLVRAAGDGDIGSVERELASTRPDARDRYANSALGCAIPRRRSEVISALLAAGANPNQPSGLLESEELPTELAWEIGDIATLRMLLDAGADPSRSTSRHENLLSRAIAAKDIGILQLLLAKGADPNGTANDVPLVKAINVRSAEAVHVLLDAKADPNGRPDNRPLVAATNNDQTLFTTILDAGADLSLGLGADPSPTVGDSALAEAAGDGSMAMVEVLLERGVDPNGDPYLGPLLRAVTFRHRLVVDRLLAAGADPNLGESDFLSLFASLSSVDSRLANDLSLFASLSSVDSRLANELSRHHGGTVPPLDWSSSVPTGTAGSGQPGRHLTRLQVPPIAAAVATRDHEILRLLLSEGADPNRLAVNEYSPLYLAAVLCDVEAVQTLLSSGAAPALSPPDRQPAKVACPAARTILGG